MIFMQNELSRRAVLGSGLAAAGVLLTGLPAFALTEASAKQLVTGAVADLNRIINSGKSERAMYGEFEKFFAKYGDVPTIARFVLGPDARGASSGELSAFAKAFQGYMSRKYGKRFREFIGGEVKVADARKVKSFVEVRATAALRGQAPFSVSFMVSDRSGSEKFFDMTIEGISLLKTEQTEIGAMLDRRGGSISKVTADLKNAG